MGWEGSRSHDNTSPCLLCFAGLSGTQVNSQLCQTPTSKEAQELKFQFTTTLPLPFLLSLLKL